MHNILSLTDVYKYFERCWMNENGGKEKKENIIILLNILNKY